MEHARWNQIEDLLQAALDLEPAERAALLSRECAGDPALRAEIEQMLAAEHDAALLETPALAALAPLDGRTIGHYRIEQRIGSGGMGDVYEARDERLDRTVAVKVLPPELVADAGRVRRLEQEAFAASRLNHPNIITIFEVVHDGNTHCIVTERVDGQTLREVLGEGTLPLERSLDVAIQIAEALKAAHTAWIIHRDIKPENVMLRADGLVKVLDFGIAQVSGAAGFGPPDAGIAGTANYMSPEQSRGEPLDGRTDLYSLGLVLRETAGPETPRELQRIIRRTLQPDREQRYSSAAELLDDLHRLKHRLENRNARRIVGFSILAAVVALSVTAIAAMLSINETWDERVLRDGHSAAARQAVFSPDGRLLVSCGEDGEVMVWDFVRRERVATLDHRAYKIAFDPNGRWLATAGIDGTIAIWDAQRWTRTRELTGLQGVIGALSVSPDGALLVAADMTHSALWRTAGWQRTARWLYGSSHGNFIFSPEANEIFGSNSLAVSSPDGRRLSEEPAIGANWMARSPDGRAFATIDGIGNVHFYRFTDPPSFLRRRLVSSHRAHQDHGRSIVWSPDGRLVASAADDIILWDPETQRRIARFEHSAIVWCTVFSPDGRWLVSTHGDGAVLIWDVAERRRVANLNEHSGSVRAVAFAPDGNRVASAGEDRTVTLWDLARGRKQAVLTDHATRVTAVSFSPDGRELASGDQDGVVIAWDLGRRQARLGEPPQWGPAYAVTISPDGRFVATSRAVVERAGFRPVMEFYPRGENWIYAGVYGLSYFPDGRLAAVTDSGWVLVLDPERRRIAARHHVVGTHQIAVSVSPDGQWLVTGEDEGAVRLWSTDPLREVTILGRHGARVKSVAFAPDGETVASAGDDKMIALWDVKQRRLRARIGTHASPIYSIAFSRDGRRLVSGEHDRTVRVYTRQRTLWGFKLD
jgi:eukaryotic-like serine/threonine-protein kinase